eukprot:CAMPEP_0172389078 /NCGR_PEP_ID=MMETSP1061-20121228/6052_1 /TAXON_ID=37318 /ORGANISM="Pseudo-nitzschia pungens, Strain cf. pungens" /LENGTH=456 /DNA_ID=CAMNT_0013119137 /DNA_START=106 /DNA_END=1476 /DNA_ORIENTATION=+
MLHGLATPRFLSSSSSSLVSSSFSRLAKSTTSNPRSPAFLRTTLGNRFSGAITTISTTTTTTTTTTNSRQTSRRHMSSSSSQTVEPPQSKSTMYWNREAYTSSPSSSFRADDGQAPVKEARIVSLSFPGDPNNLPLEGGNEHLPTGARLLQIGGTLEDLDIDALVEEKANVVFVSPGVTRETLAGLIETVPSLEWIHCRSAGIDVLTSDTLANTSDETLVMTNAKGAFSSTLAEYTMLAISYFAKDLPLLLRNKRESKWQKYSVEEIRGSTLGVIGYGDIGRAAAKLAKAYGMTVIALRKNVPSAEQIAADPFCDAVYGDGSDNLNRLFAESDYVLCSAPLTPATHKMIGRDQFDAAKKGCVFINVGRGPIVDEEALVAALQEGRLRGAGLDVFTKEPLDEDSELWKLDNVLLSPHNMDQTDTFMLESTQFFVDENLPRFLHGQTLLNPVDKKAGY